MSSCASWSRGLLAAAVMLVAVACGQNPVLGDWEIDRQETGSSALGAAEATDLLTLTLRTDAIVAKETEIPVSYVVEGDRVRLLREDGRGEHLIELLPDGRIRVELPIGVIAVYKRAGA